MNRPQALRRTAVVPSAPKRSKYGNRKTVVDGITFDSAKEARRYGELRLMERAGLIRDLQTQRALPLIVNDHDCGTYRADFVYATRAGVIVVEDVKSEITRKNPVYRLKAKLVRAIHGVDIVEV